MEDDACAPRQVGPMRSVTVTGMLFPWDDEAAGPVLLHMVGVSTEIYYLPLFSTPEELHTVLANEGVSFDGIKQVQDGPEFLLSVPPNIVVITDLRFMPGDRIRFLQIDRSSFIANPGGDAAR